MGATALARRIVRGSRLGKPDMADIARLHEVLDGAHRLLDRHGRVDAGRHVEVDPVRAEALQAVGAGGLDGGRPGIEADEAAVGSALRAELHLQEDLAPPAGQGFPDQKLVVAHAVEVAGVEDGDAGVEGRVDCCDALGPVRRPIDVRHPHAAEADRRDLGTVLAELACAHASLPREAASMTAPSE